MYMIKFKVQGIATKIKIILNKKNNYSLLLNNFQDKKIEIFRFL